jgi:hypothetical protein
MLIALDYFDPIALNFILKHLRNLKFTRILLKLKN